MEEDERRDGVEQEEDASATVNTLSIARLSPSLVVFQNTENFRFW